MFRHYLFTATRFLFKNKTFSLINIIGLSIGTLCCLYIVLYVHQQYNYDTHHKHGEDIYRITSSLILPGNQAEKMATASPPVAPAMKNDFAEVQQFTRLAGTIGINQHLLRFEEKSLYEKDALFVDSTFFDVFSYHFEYGNQLKALSEPYSVVLLKPTADKLFGHQNPLNNTITIDNGYGKHDFKVTGVVDESLGKSHIHANMFITMNSGGIGDYVRSNTSWAGNNFTSSYVKLHPNSNVAALEKKLPAFLQKYGQQQLKELGMKKELHLQPITTIHITKGYKAEQSEPVNPSFLQILLIIAALIQLIACINFMNLSTARASKRAKEVGVRKVIGAERKDLIRQFLGESFLLSLLAMLLTIPLLLLALPYLNDITKADIELSLFRDYRLWIFLSLVIITTGIIAGSYPAFYLSAFKAIKVMKGNFTNHISAAGVRKALVVLQFSLSIVLIISIVVIYTQLSFIKNKDLGFDPEQTIVFTFHTNESKNKIEALSADLRNLADVKAVSRANNYLSQFVWNDIGVFLQGGNMTTSRDAPFMVSDENFVKANGIKLVSGRDFRPHDSSRVLINETLVKQLGLNPETAPGTILYWKATDVTTVNLHIIGVMKDFNYNSLHEEVKPFMLVYNSENDPFMGNQLNNVIVATSSKDYKSLLEKIEVVWRKHVPFVPFEYVFLNDEVQNQYQAELTLGRIINLFALMAVIVSCLGLFGLSAFTAEQRRKEIGVRKVLGAKIFQITTLLSKDFLILVCVAMLIASPVAWWAMNKWLQGFAYRIHVSWWMFAAAGLISVFIAMVTVSFQALKAAVANPVRSLRSE
jgi:putative ABC transport system permease protein